MRWKRNVWTALCLIPIALAGGCAVDGPREIVIDSANYEAAFEAAIEATRRTGMPAVLRDRRHGVIETEIRTAGSLAEPWRWDNASLGQAFENTANEQRRRVHFEFSPVDAHQTMIDPDEPLRGPDYAGVAAAPIDLTEYAGPIRIACTVVVERNHRIGVRRSTWTRRQTSQTKLGGRDADLPSSNWTPTARDEAYERRLLAEVEEILESDELRTTNYELRTTD